MKDYLKELLSFSRKELNGLLVLMCLLFLLLSARWLTGWLLPRPNVDFTAFEREITSLQADTSTFSGGRPSPGGDKPYFRGLASSRRPVRSGEKEKSADYPLPDTASLFPFDPNTISRTGLLKLGLRPRIADVLLNYRAAGGTFYKKEDMAKIYGLRAELYKRLLPYIQVSPPEQNAATRAKPTEEPGNSAEDRPPAGRTADTICVPLEINGAAPEDLLPLRGIGHVLSERIVKYRERLGGFYSVDQLLEVYGMDTAAFRRFRECLRADSSLLKKIPINEAGYEELRRLPYWTSAQIRVVLSYRGQHGRFARLNALYDIQALDKPTIQKVIPYLRVNQNQSKNE